jgi:hypothetical protein
MESVAKKCFRNPIPEAYDAAKYLDAAVSAHQSGKKKIAEGLIELADMPAIREWVESIWGKKSLYITIKKLVNTQPRLAKELRVKTRMPSSLEKKLLHQRDGFHCRFCGIPLIRKEIRNELRKHYPIALKWGAKNIDQHPAFQAMWLQYDHIIPHARGGNNDLENIIITCGPCNFGRVDSLIEEVGLLDPRLRSPIQSNWDGLERLLIKKD